MSNLDYINASEIAEYTYCNRAWFLKRSGYTSQNLEALSHGAVVHTHYAQAAAQVNRREQLARLLLVIGGILIVVYLVVRLLA